MTMQILDWSMRSMYRSVGRKMGIFSQYQLLDNSFDALLYINHLRPKGKIVLDVGANNGDSAKLFLDHGAKEVVCIERNERYARKIKLPKTRVIIEPFKLSHLEIPHDVAKIDIEGGEAILLNSDVKMKPTIMEVHSSDLIKRFRNKGWIFVTYMGSYETAMMVSDPRNSPL